MGTHENINREREEEGLGRRGREETRYDKIS
jgi:hypothetical protein